MAHEFIAGCIGGCAGLIVGHPFDTVKVHLQNDNTRMFKNSMQCFKTLVVKEGVRGLYKGISSPLLGVAAINATVFGVQGATQKNMKNKDTLTSHFVAGSAAGLFQSFICSPMELAKSYLQISPKNSSRGLIYYIQVIYQQNGIKGLYKGINLTIARETPAFGAYFFTYEFLTRKFDKKKVTTSTMIFAGGCAGLASWFFVYPIDVIKTRFQLDCLNKMPKYSGSIDCFKKTVEVEGFRFLVRGLAPTLLRAFPVNAAIFTVFTWTIRFFESDFYMRNESFL